MRNYCKFYALRAVIKEYAANGTFLGEFENTFVASDAEHIYEPFGVYAAAFQGTHKYVLSNPDAGFDVWIELSRENVLHMFSLLATAFDEVIAMWTEVGAGFSGTIPENAMFDELFVYESPRDTWSNGK